MRYLRFGLQCFQLALCNFGGDPPIPSSLTHARLHEWATKAYQPTGQNSAHQGTCLQGRGTFLADVAPYGGPIKRRVRTGEITDSTDTSVATPAIPATLNLENADASQ